MSWVDALPLLVLATFCAGFYALFGARGYRRLLIGWLASLAGAILGYALGHAIGLSRPLWLGSLPWLEAILGAILLQVVALRLRV